MCYHGWLHLMNCAGEVIAGMEDILGKMVSFSGEE